jgi:hypothetical protein
MRSRCVASAREGLSHEPFYPEDEDIQVRLGHKDRPVDVTAYSSAATAFEDERDGQGGFVAPDERIERL